MTPDIARALLPQVRDLLNYKADSFYMGVVIGSCDVLEKLGLITEPEYHLLCEQASRDTADLLKCLEEKTTHAD